MAAEEDFVSFDAPRLCATCQGISPKDMINITGDFSFLKGRELLPHHEDFVSFEAAIKEGCYICTRVRDDLLNGDEKAGNSEGGIIARNPFSKYRVLLIHKPDFFVCVDICLKNRDTRFILYSSEDYPSPDTLSASTSSRPTRSLLQSWFKTCLVQHSSCDHPSLGDWTPTRVLDLGVDPSTWKLCLPAVDSVPVPEYTTMSYCWGDAHFLKLTLDLLDIFRSGLPISSLPQAFQDAISITKDLGIRFIWIDALCILQDVKDDFTQECTSMSSIYANSSCNIVATFGKNPHKSLFRTRNYQSPLTGKLINSWKVHDSHLDIWLGMDAIVKEDHFSEEILNWEISKRGWILQEILLAPRSLYFGMNQVHWICQSLEACEIWPEGVPPRTDTLVDAQSHLFRSSNDGQEFDNLNLQWNDIVNRYSALALSHPEDKLVALSGLVKVIQHRTQDEYLWGHWMSALPLSLNWFIPSGSRYHHGPIAKFGLLSKSCGRRSSIYRAPSWSWASIDGIVDFEQFWDDKRYVNICNVLDVHTSTTGPNPGDGAVDGQLTLRAPWKTATVLGDDRLSMPYFPSNTHRERVRWDGDSIPDGSKVDLAVTVITWYQFFTTNSNQGNEQSEHSGRELSIKTLILLPLEANPGFHMRVGVLSIDSEFQEESIPRTELEAFGLNVIDEEIRNISVSEESSLRTFKVI